MEGDSTDAGDLSGWTRPLEYQKRENGELQNAPEPLKQQTRGNMRHDNWEYQTREQEEMRFREGRFLPNQPTKQPQRVSYVQKMEYEMDKKANLEDNWNETMKDVSAGITHVGEKVAEIWDAITSAPLLTAQGVNSGVKNLPLPGHEAHFHEGHKKLFTSTSSVKEIMPFHPSTGGVKLTTPLESSTKQSTIDSSKGLGALDLPYAGFSASVQASRQPVGQIAEHREASPLVTSNPHPIKPFHTANSPPDPADPPLELSTPLALRGTSQERSRYDTPDKEFGSEWKVSPLSGGQYSGGPRRSISPVDLRDVRDSAGTAGLDSSVKPRLSGYYGKWKVGNMSVA